MRQMLNLHRHRLRFSSRLLSSLSGGAWLISPERNASGSLMRILVRPQSPAYMDAGVGR